MKVRPKLHQHTFIQMYMTIIIKKHVDPRLIASLSRLCCSLVQASNI
jgi:hypothetical protein